MENLLQIINDDYGVFINLNLKNKEILSLEHNMLTRNNIRGLTKISYKVFDDKMSYNYDITSKISLKMLLEKEISARDIIEIFRNIVLAIENSKKYLIGINQILFDSKHIYIDISSLDVYMICIPIKIDRVESNVDFRAFFKDVLSVTQIKKDDYSRYIIDIINIVNSSYKYSLNDFYDKLISLIEIFDKRKNNCQYSEMIYGDKCDVANTTHINLEENENEPDYEKGTLEIIEDINKNANKLDEKNIDLTNQEKIDIPNSSDKKGNKKKIKKSRGFIPFSISDILKINKNEDEEIPENMNLLICENDILDDKDEPSNEYDIENIESSKIVKKKNENEVGETIFIKDVSMGNPYLLSVISGEIFNIETNPCRIGKESRFADVLISDNETVSRAHAQIVRELENYYLVDNNSKNHTFVNEMQINSEEKVHINHNDLICFSNEKFIFKEF